MSWIKKYIEILQCPYCRGSLYFNKSKNKLICKRCNREYEVIDNIPILLRY